MTAQTSKRQRFNPEELICIQMHRKPASLDEGAEKPL